MSFRCLSAKGPVHRFRRFPLSVGCLIFPQMDQIDFTGPFEILSRMPDTKVHVVGKDLEPIRDVQRLLLTPDTCVARAGDFVCTDGGKRKTPKLQIR
ncbi:hypothetical protein H7849_04395 [Alloacidobacterium dinghuense]|uniref:Uncharacterized protein n=1 Tax=Alloacidobacterium dinghuense TaxID=2763107 RepID=A0A7G8BKZ4_9BACT|nr:hypothetical protein [Alloacidobacterium dinghuense]QNI33214.1 hypothetical protein H7849_04395 [Alloacidobacterium dinghuense]